jgi:hypothetical protein
MIVELVEEVRRLRDLRTARKARRGEDFDDDCIMPFGQYKGETMADIPDDYLIYWRDRNRLGEILCDIELGRQPAKAIAQLKLRIYEYSCKRLSNETTQVRSDGTEIWQDNGSEET